jgi:hypothetical protein
VRCLNAGWLVDELLSLWRTGADVIFAEGRLDPAWSPADTAILIAGPRARGEGAADWFARELARGARPEYPVILVPRDGERAACVLVCLGSGRGEVIPLSRAALAETIGTIVAQGVGALRGLASERGEPDVSRLGCNSSGTAEGRKLLFQTQVLSDDGGATVQTCVYDGGSLLDSQSSDLGPVWLRPVEEVEALVAAAHEEMRGRWLAPSHETAEG